MGMYEARQPIEGATGTTDLQQGDLIADLLIPEAFTAASFQMRRKNQIFNRATASDITDASLNDIKLMCSVKRTPFTMVVSSTCDNFQETSPILVAQVVDYSFDEGMSDAEKWRQVSADATGLGSPKLFYLSENPAHNFPRSQAALPRLVPLSHKYLQLCFGELGAKRDFGLMPAAQRHLQYALSAFLGRNAREESDWASDADCALHVAWLQQELKNPGRYKERYEAELAALLQRLSPGSEAAASTTGET